VKIEAIRAAGSGPNGATSWTAAQQKDRRLWTSARGASLPATDKQDNSIIVMYRNFSEWRFDDKEAKWRCESEFQSMHQMIDPSINTDDSHDRSACGDWIESMKPLRLSSVSSPIGPCTPNSSIESPLSILLHAVCRTPGSVSPQGV